MEPVLRPEKEPSQDRWSFSECLFCKCLLEQCSHYAVSQKRVVSHGSDPPRQVPLYYHCTRTTNCCSGGVILLNTEDVNSNTCIYNYRSVHNIKVANHTPHFSSFNNFVIDRHSPHSKQRRKFKHLKILKSTEKF
jgi:hypothetical protein